MATRKTPRVVRKLRDVRINRIDNRRVDLTIPQEVLDRAKVKAGDSVALHVTRDLHIILRPLRPNWPVPCGRTEGCLMAQGHQGDCVGSEDLPY